MQKHLLLMIFFASSMNAVVSNASCASCNEMFRSFHEKDQKYQFATQIIDIVTPKVSSITGRRLLKCVSQSLDCPSDDAGSATEVNRASKLCGIEIEESSKNNDDVNFILTEIENAITQSCQKAGAGTS